MKIGRNEPCPCGSKMKYKKCCLDKINNTLAEYRILLGTQQAIKNKLVQWATQNMGEELDEYSVYFTGEHFQDIAERGENETEKENEENGSELVEFFEWLFLEAIYHQKNKRVIEVIRNDCPELFTPRELQIIDEWIRNTQAGIYEVKNTSPTEYTFNVKEIFSNKEFEIFDIKGSSHIVRGDVFFGRLQTIFSKHYFSGVLSGLSREWLSEFKEFITTKYQEAKKVNPSLNYEEFMNTNSKIVYDYAPPPLKILGPAGDEVKVCEATYILQEVEPEEVVDWLAKNTQFVLTEEKYGRKGNITTAHFIHLAEEKKIFSTTEHEVITFGEFHDEEGNIFKTDGSIEFRKNKWVVFSTSNKIFDLLKQELGRQFKGNFNLEKEKITPMEKIRADKRTNSPPKKKSKEIQKLEKEYMIRYYLEWCDMEIPLLNNQTPRQAITTEPGREAVRKLLLDLENKELHDQKESRKSIPIVKTIRKELNFYD